jgi:Arc/MetJ family transcription regulator
MRQWRPEGWRQVGIDAVMMSQTAPTRLSQTRRSAAAEVRGRGYPVTLTSACSPASGCRLRLAACWCGYTEAEPYILLCVGKHLVDIDEAALAAARAELGTATIKDTVNESLRAAASSRALLVGEALDVLAGFDLRDRDDAWR